MFFSNAAQAEPINVGAAAPALKVTVEDGTQVDLAAVYPKGFTLVYFYPKAGTSGCTAQGCSLRDAFADLTKAGVTVFGVSSDTVEAQKKFRDEERFPFHLVADTEQKLINAFGVPTKTVPLMGTMPARQAFLIGNDGKIVWRDLKATTKQQAADVLAALKTLEK